MHALILVAIGPALAAPPGCESASTTADVAEALARAETRYIDLDVEGFLASLDDAEVRLACVSDPVPRYLAASLHRFQGLRGFVDRAPARSMAAFASARALEPDYVFPETLVPAGNPVLDDYTALDPAASARVELPAKANGRLQIDGSAARERPTERPVVLQLFSASGAVESTHYLWPDTPVPPYPVAATAPPATEEPEPEPVVPPQPVATEAGGKVSVPLAVATGAAVLATGSLYAGSWMSRQAWKTTDEPDRIAPLRGQTNGLVVASGIAAGATVGLGLTTVLTARF